jgi:hypothetical protein
LILLIRYLLFVPSSCSLSDTIFCVDIEKYEPDIVLIDFAVNDMGPPKLMEALIRKTLAMKSKPIVLLVRLKTLN